MGKKVLTYFTIIIGVLLFIFLAAWPFRWVEGPTQTIDNLKITHLRDRCTGQSWYRLYGEISKEKKWDFALHANTIIGVNGNQFYSGEEIPHISQHVIQDKQNEVLRRPDYQTLMSLIETRINESTKGIDKSQLSISDWSHKKAQEDKIKLENDARNVAIKELTDNAYQNRVHVTKLWTITLIILCIFFIISLILRHLNIFKTPDTN